MIIHHTAITVIDLEKSQRFYEQLFGLKKIGEWERKEQGLSGVYLEDEKGNRLELIQPDNIEPKVGDYVNLKEIGVKHIAFVVDDIENVFKKATEQYDSEVIWSIQEGESIKKIAFISDPSGIPIEIVEL